MTENDIKFIKRFAKLDSEVKKAQEYVKEHFGTNTKYDPKDSIIIIESSKPAKAVAAKEYLDTLFADDFVDAVFD